MALADRDYMRDDGPPSWRGGPSRPGGLKWSPTILLVAVIGLAFLFQSDLTEAARGNLALAPEKFWRGAVWQLLTFQFLHANFSHVLGNLIALWSFGRALEQRISWGRFFTLYFVSGVVGGLLQAVLAWLSPKYFGGHSLVGASAGVCGVFAAYAMFDPRAEVLLFYFIPVSARKMYLGAVVFSVGLAVFYPGTQVAHAAHLGGLLAGAAFVRLGFFRNRSRSRTYQELDGPAWLEKSPARREPAPESGPTEFISREVDPILDKISAHGLDSLTEREKEILKSARQKMERR